MITIEQTITFADWFSGLRDVKGQRQIAKRLAMFEAGHPGDVKSVGDKVWEMRFHFGPGYRVYYAWRGETMVLLLVGGDKDTQDRDIRKAKEIAAGL